MTNRLVGRAATAIFAISLVAAACGSSNNSSSSTEAATTVEATTTTASAQALCAARDQLKTSIEALTSLDIVKNGTSSLTSAIDEVKNNLQAVKSAATDQLKPQVDDFTTKLQALQDAVGNAGSGGASQIISAATAAARSGATLLSSLQSMSCPGDTGS